MPSLTVTKLTLGSCLSTFFGDPVFRNLAASTRDNYSRALYRTKPLWDIALNEISRSDLRGVLDTLNTRPGEATIFIVASRRFFAYALDHDWVVANPMVGFKSPKLGHTERWPERAPEQIIYGTGSWAVWTAAYLGLYTGQRLSDILKMQWQDMNDDGISITQQKTGEKLVIPLHPRLKESVLQQWGQGNLNDYICSLGTDHPQRPWKIRSFRAHAEHEFARLGFSGLKWHGLRVEMACRLAEAGASTREIMAIGGWRKSGTVDHYTAGVSQKELALKAIARLK